MSTYARLTLIGLFNHKPEIFDKLTLPAEYNRDTFIDTVLFDQGEKCVAYPDPDFFMYAVGVWSRKWHDSLQRIAFALQEEYNPLHNFDRYETWKENEKGDYENEVQRGGSDTLSKTGTMTTDRDGTVTTTDAGTVTTDNDGTVTTKNAGTVTTTETGTNKETTTDMVTEKTVSAFNESGYQPDEKSTTNGTVTREPNTTQIVTPDTTETATTDATQTETRDTTETATTDASDVVTYDTQDETAYGATEAGSGNDTREKLHTAHLFGNIGVTTSQKMAIDEVELRKNYNMYSVAATLFADDLLLMLY